MTEYLGSQMTDVEASPMVPASPKMWGTPQLLAENVSLVGLLNGDTVKVAKLPKGCYVRKIEAIVSVAQGGTATFAFGSADDATKWSPATVMNATTFINFGDADNMGEALAEDEDLILTIGAANATGAIMRILIWIQKGN